MQKKKKNTKQKLTHKLKNKYKLVILNADTFEEKISLKLSPMNVFVITGLAAILLIFLTTIVIAFTPLREYIPGYPSSDMKNTIYKLALKADSMDNAMKDKDLYIENIKSIISGKNEQSESDIEKNPGTPKVDYNKINYKKSKEDSLLRVEIENIDNYSINANNNLYSQPKHYNGLALIKEFFFFTPLKGITTNLFDPVNNHYGIDIVAGKNEAIKATLDGTVIFAGWTLETGYVIALQHENNIISIYKHNSTLLKQQGNYVKAGDPIAIIGETGEMSTGPHLHFELWFDCNPVNPADYIAF